ncbi:MAG TPA: glycoside hydrolase family 3 N-terminal domain-containing protein [Niabella sp.]
MKYMLMTLAVALPAVTVLAQKSIYHKDWIDLNKNGKKDLYEDPSIPVDIRVKDLLSQMTIDEKTCQTATLYGYGRVLKDEMPTPEWKQEIWKDGIANIDEELNGLARNKKAQTKYSYPFSTHAEAINKIQKWFVEETRLGIPVDFTNEGIHGLNQDHATAFPAPIGIGATWNKDLVHRMGQIVGQEARALGYTNVYAPILDVARDQRWGRVVETYGEDPFLVAGMGIAMAAGIQEKGVASTLKHFAVYSVPKGGRDGNARTDPHVAPREMYQLFLYPFRKVIQNVHPMGVMSSYNDWDGMPVTSSNYFLTQLLRQQFGFDGYVVSDSRAVEFVAEKHHVAKDYKEAVKMVMEAGLNVRTDFTPPDTFILPLRQLVKEGGISMETLDQRVGEVLKVKFKLGLFDQPYVKDPKAADQIVATAASEAVALEMNRQSLVLLKNEHKLLPLSLNQYKNILVTGPLADEKEHAISRYGPSNKKVISVLEGIQNYVGNKAKVQYVKGCEVADATWPESEIIDTPLTRQETDDINKAVEAAKQSDIVLAVVGEDDKRVGESLSRTGLNLPGRQLKLLEALKQTGKPIVMILINGQPLTINWENRYLDAILETWFPGPQGGTAIAEALFGVYNPGGKLTTTFPKTTGQIEMNFPFKPASHAGQPGDGPNGYGKTAVVGPLYPFGYGLSYTSFEYSNLQVAPEKGRTQSDITVSADIKNTGAVKGDEVVQLYVQQLVSSVTTYESILRGFERVSLNPGETKTVHFRLTPDDLSILDKDNNFVVEPGAFNIMIGSSSVDIRLKKQIELE